MSRYPHKIYTSTDWVNHTAFLFWQVPRNSDCRSFPENVATIDLTRYPNNFFFVTTRLFCSVDVSVKRHNNAKAYFGEQFLWFFQGGHDYLKSPKKANIIEQFRPLNPFPQNYGPDFFHQCHYRISHTWATWFELEIFLSVHSSKAFMFGKACFCEGLFVILRSKCW